MSVRTTSGWIATALLLAGIVPAQGAARTWVGGVAGNSWLNTNNWVEQVIPAGGDTVTIPSGKTVLLTSQTAYLGSFSITNSTLTFTNWTTALRATNITLWNNGKFTLPAAFSNAPVMSNRVWVIGSNFTFHAGASILADGLGYANASGPGKGTQGTGGSGSGHGGKGGMGSLRFNQRTTGPG